MHSQQPPGVVQNWSTLQCSKQNTEQCGYDHAPVTRGRMRAQFPLPHGPSTSPPALGTVYCGFSQDNVAAVTAMRERMAKLPTPKASTPLHTAEQQQLMLRFRWDKDFTCLQSCQFFKTEGHAQNWQGLDKLGIDELSTVLPKESSNVVLVLKDTEISQCIELQHRLNRDLPPNRLDMLVAVTTQVPFSQWCDQTLQKMSATPESFSRLTRRFHLAAGGTMDFWVISFTPQSISQRLKPVYNTVRLLSQGSTLESKDAILPPPPTSTFAIDMTENDMSETMLHMGLSGAQCFNVAGPINLRPPNKPLHTKIFLLDLNAQERSKFIDAHNKKDHFSVMSPGEFDGSAFHDQEAVLEVFYKKTHKEHYSKNLWLTLHTILTDSLPEPASWSLQIAGPNKVRLGLKAPEDLYSFVQGPYVQLQANGLLFKDEKQRDWFNPDSESDASSVCSTRSSTSGQGEGTSPPQALVAYNVPIWLRDTALRDFLSSNGFAVDTLTRSTWNPGRMTTAAWKLQGPHLPQTSVILHDAQKNTSITIIPLKEFNDLKRDSTEARKRQQPAGKTTYARATRNDKLIRLALLRYYPPMGVTRIHVCPPPPILWQPPSRRAPSTPTACPPWSRTAQATSTGTHKL